MPKAKDVLVTINVNDEQIECKGAAVMPYYQSLDREELDRLLRYPKDYEIFNNMHYDDWVHCVKINPTIIMYTNKPEVYLTPEVIAIVAISNVSLFKHIKKELTYDDYTAMYKLGGMGVFYSLYNHIDLEDQMVKNAINDAKYEQMKEAYQKYCKERDMVESMDTWIIFRDFYNEKHDIMDRLKGITEYHNYTLCRTLRNEESISTAAYGLHKDLEKFGNDAFDIAKGIMEKYEDTL